MTTLEKIHRRAKRTAAGCLELPPQGTRRYPDVWVSEFGKKLNSHRAVWILVNGPVPDGLCVLHRCDNGRCVEPSHLWLGTMADNMHDRDAKGRNGTWAGDSPLAKLTQTDVDSIRLLLEMGMSPSEISVWFSVSAITIERIRDGKTWKPFPSPSQ